MSVDDGVAAPPGHLLANLLHFGSVLRGIGLDASPARMAEIARALAWIDLGRKAEVRTAMRALVVRRRAEIAAFDDAFDTFWRAPKESVSTLDLQALGERRRFRRPRFEPPSKIGPSEGAGDSASGSENEPPILRASYEWSGGELLRHKDFADLTEEERREVEQFLAALAWRPAAKKIRRLRSGRGTLTDLRRTLRASLARGGEIVEWQRRERGVRPRPILVLADISGSMERYTRLLLVFVRALAEAHPRDFEAFVFGTRLTRVTRELRQHGIDEALQRVARAVPDWSGGTRIGEAVETFTRHWIRRLPKGPVVLLISDGWDRGDPARLAAATARLQRHSHRLIWLNPLLGSIDYEPSARGMRAALPFVDDFLPVHNLAGLQALAGHLESLPANRPPRRRAVRASMSPTVAGRRD